MINNLKYTKWVLSLASAKERREKFFSQKHAKDFKVYNAINGKLEKNFIEENFDFSKAETLYQRKISLGEAACTLSHLAIWKEIIKDDEIKFSIICEDDAVFSESYPILEKILSDWFESGRINDVAFIIFGESKIPTFNRKIRHRIGYPMQFFAQKYKLNQNYSCSSSVYVGEISKNYTCGTVGYVVSSQFIKNLMAKMINDKPFWLADDFEVIRTLISNNDLLTGANIWHLQPRLVKEDQILVSELEQERKNLQRKGVFYIVWQYVKFILKCPVLYTFLRWNTMNRARKNKKLANIKKSL
ncbi:glycosyltransferase family 25 protein [Gallibacterium trehalosifermentans]|uniref:Glycosyltransferase family 25 protein n=1 Tax=Gallibacterium trehalosifermentans TaxID=516935 RepID=A0ABV6GY37_9PAST